MNFSKISLHILCIFLIIIFLLPFSFCYGTSDALSIQVNAPSAILIEANTRENSL